MIPEKLLRELDEEARRAGVYTVILLTRDIIDYFVDVARVTDGVEMGGFLLGRVFKKSCIALVFYDYVQARNVSSTPETEFDPDDESLREVYSMLVEGKYDVVAMVHTHPDEGAFSSIDLGSAREFSEKVVKQLRILGRLRELGVEKLTIPGFLVSDGGHPELYAYTYGEPFVLALLVDTKTLYTKSLFLYDVDKKYYFHLIKMLLLFHKPEPEVKDYILKAISGCYYASVDISKLEKLLPPEV